MLFSSFHSWIFSLSLSVTFPLWFLMLLFIYLQMEKYPWIQASPALSIWVANGVFFSSPLDFVFFVYYFSYPQVNGKESSIHASSTVSWIHKFYLSISVENDPSFCGLLIYYYYLFLCFLNVHLSFSVEELSSEKFSVPIWLGNTVFPFRHCLLNSIFILSIVTEFLIYFLHWFDLQCSWGHPSRLPTLSGYAWHHCYHPHCSCSSDGWRKCETAPNPNKVSFPFVVCSIKVLFFHQFFILQHYFTLPGWESQSSPDYTVCQWIEHFAAKFLWYSVAGCDRRILYLCCPHHLDHPCWSIQQCCRSSWGLLLNIAFYFFWHSNDLTLVRASFRSYSMQKFLRIMRGTQGALIVASTLQIIVGFSGLWRNVTRFVFIIM